MKKVLSVVIAITIISILLIGVIELPEFGAAEVPANNYVTERYIEKGVQETGALNIVTGIILDYRAFDTFVEATVLFTAAIIVTFVLKKHDEIG
ncbi:hydrogen gas-evolving membrane-bound hydrogenase subunit E [Brassicibacter mesophilus]|jgi:multisubunit Na+/H+ antiporter MnhB subunit|uniref:hydrogen gas-evolving membrane-bound hydrogenase subunit E n=1 Tax=Brassicibacter mesophilus TaxID=745119 RepID=UPI003D1AA2EA